MQTMGAGVAQSDTLTNPAPPGGAWYTGDTDPLSRFALPFSPPGTDADAFQAIIPLNGSNVSVHACKSPALLSQVWQGFAGYPRGFAAGVLQVSAISGALGQQNRLYAGLRNQQLAAVLYAAIHRPDVTFKVLSWLAHNQLSGEIASVAGRMAGSWFTSYALKFTRLPWTLAVAGTASNFMIAAYGSAILRIADDDTELVRIIGAIITGRGDFDVCIPLDLFKQEIQKLQVSKDPVIAKAFEFLREVQEFAAKLGAG